MIIQSIFGLVAFIFFAWTLSENRRQIPYKTIIAGTIATCMTGAIAGIVS